MTDHKDNWEENVNEIYLTREEAYQKGHDEGVREALESIEKNALWGQDDRGAKCLYPENLKILIQEALTALLQVKDGECKHELINGTQVCRKCPYGAFKTTEA